MNNLNKTNKLLSYLSSLKAGLVYLYDHAKFSNPNYTYPLEPSNIGYGLKALREAVKLNESTSVVVLNTAGVIVEEYTIKGNEARRVK